MRCHQKPSFPVILDGDLPRRLLRLAGQAEMAPGPGADTMPISRADFASLYEERRTEIYRYLLSFQVSSPDAQEFTQESFLRLFQAVASGVRVGNPRAWLYRVAHNLATDQRRLDAVGIEYIDEAYLIAAKDETPEVAILGKERSRRLMDAISDLSKQQRACIHLRAEGLRYHEIAAILGISTPTVGEFLQRAIKRMRMAIYE